MVITPENFMIWWQEHSEKVWQIDTGRQKEGQTDGQTDGRTERTVLRAAWSQLKCFWYSSQWWAMNLLTSPHITGQSRNTFINIYSTITKKYMISYPWPHLGIITAFITEKCLLDYDTCLIERSRWTSNPAGGSSPISNSAGRLLCVTWFELFSQLATPGRSYARKIRNHSCGGPVG